MKGKREGGERAGSTLTAFLPAKDMLSLMGDLSYSTDGVFFVFRFTCEHYLKM